MTTNNLTLIRKSDLLDLYDQVDALRSIGRACRAFTTLLDPDDLMQPLLDLLFDQVDEKTAELSYMVELLRN